MSKEMELKDKVANLYLLFAITRGTLSNMGFTGKLDQSQLSSICYNKIHQKFAKQDSK